jgi:hypothetical protein
MDVDNIKEMAGKFFKGCGCLTVGSFLILLIIGIFVDDEELDNIHNWVTKDSRIC